jgi:hypothetical protein
MPEEKWQVVEKVGGTLQAEILRGLLEAQGIWVTLSQEGAGHYGYASNIGTFGQVEILVPSSQTEQALQVLRDYYAGVFEKEAPDEVGIPEEPETGEEDEEKD